MDNEEPNNINSTNTNQSKPNKWYRIGLVLIILIVSLIIGIAGYHYLANLNFVDSLLNSSMILGGMGPVDVMPNNSSKVFASFYALYSGVIFLVIIAFLIDSIAN